MRWEPDLPVSTLDLSVKVLAEPFCSLPVCMLKSSAWLSSVFLLYSCRLRRFAVCCDPVKLRPEDGLLADIAKVLGVFFLRVPS